MERGFLFILLCFALFTLTLGCKPSEAQIREAIAETEIVQAGATLTEQAKSTNTPHATMTPKIT